MKPFIRNLPASAEFCFVIVLCFGLSIFTSIRVAFSHLLHGAKPVPLSVIDDARRENLQGLLMSLNMLIEFGDAFDYSGADFRKWCGQPGFKRFEVIHLAGPSSAAVACKG
jgi:hypothetical protein